MKYLKIFSNLLVAVLAGAGIVLLLPKGILFFMPFVIGYLISIPADCMVRLLEKHSPVKRKFVSVFYIILVLALIVILLGEGGTLLYNELQTVAGELPEILSEVKAEITDAVAQLQTMLSQIPFAKSVDLSALAQSLSDSFLASEQLTGGSLAAGIAGVVKKVPDMVVYTIVAILAAYFFVADKEKITGFYQKIVPESVRSVLSGLYAQSIGAVGGYFKAQLKIMCVIYGVLLLGLLLLKVKYAWLVGIGIAFVDMLPIFGTGTVLIPWAAVKALSGDYVMCAGLLALSMTAFIVHQAIQPKMISDTVGLDSFVALLLMYLGYRINGALGMLVVLPIGMVVISMAGAGAFDKQIWCIKELIKDFNRFRAIGELRGEEKRQG